MESSYQSTYQGIKMNSHDQAAHPQDTTDNTRASEGNDHVITVAANLLKNVTDTRPEMNKFYCCKGSAT